MSDVKTVVVNGVTWEVPWYRQAPSVDLSRRTVATAAYRSHGDIPPWGPAPRCDIGVPGVRCNRRAVWSNDVRHFCGRHQGHRKLDPGWSVHMLAEAARAVVGTERVRARARSLLAIRMMEINVPRGWAWDYASLSLVRERHDPLFVRLAVYPRGPEGTWRWSSQHDMRMRWGEAQSMTVAMRRAMRSVRHPK